MRMRVEGELLEICRGIVNRHMSEREWAARESDDIFQSKSYSGGFDATERAFCFSFYSGDGREYWFQLSLSEVEDVVRGLLAQIEMRPAD